MNSEFRVKHLATGDIYPVGAGGTTIGRTNYNNIAIDSGLLSKFHANLKQTPEGVQVEDLNSTNGTFVNGGRIDASTLLFNGDVIQVGNERFVLLGADENDEATVFSLNLSQQPAISEPQVIAADVTYVSTDKQLSPWHVTQQTKDLSTKEINGIVSRALHGKTFDSRHTLAILVGISAINSGQIFSLAKSQPSWQVGRVANNDLVLDDPTVSQQHARFSLDIDGQLQLTDQQSTNGTRISNVRIIEGICRDGDIIDFGKQSWVLRIL